MVLLKSQELGHEVRTRSRQFSFFVCRATVRKLRKDSMQTQTLSLSSEIDAYMLKSGVRNGGWYVGITSDVEKRLFGDHNVSREGWWIHGHCSSATEARALEAAYHNVGCKGAGGGGDSYSAYIYAYVITQSTVE
jgi:hypothetical protein